MLPSTAPKLAPTDPPKTGSAPVTDPAVDSYLYTVWRLEVPTGYSVGLATSFDYQDLANIQRAWPQLTGDGQVARVPRGPLFIDNDGLSQRTGCFHANDIQLGRSSLLAGL